jgi:hypothetical protein
MEYNDEQRAIIRRMGEISGRLDVAMEASREAHSNMRMDLLNFATELASAMRRSEEIHALARDHGNAFREFLDTL